MPQFLRSFFGVGLFLAVLIGAACSHAPSHSGPGGPERARVIVFIWDGLRPDAISRTDTPNLYALRQQGSEFTDHHSVYPTFTMVNAAALATGNFPGNNAYYGNYIFQPGPEGKDTAGKAVHFDREVVFTEDFGVLRSLDANLGRRLLSRPTLFETAQRAGLKTATIGKTGPAFLQDLHLGGVVIDEQVVLPDELREELRAALPSLRWPLGPEKLATLADGVTPDPTAKSSRHAKANAEMIDVYMDHVLVKAPALTVLWLRDPDSTAHVYGLGSPAYRDALVRQDVLLGKLLDRLRANGMRESVDLLVMSDHGHTSVGNPLRSTSAATGEPEPGEIRLAHLLTQAGFEAYNGTGCLYSPALSPYPTKESHGECPGLARYSTPSYLLPTQLGPQAVIVAVNGGTDYLYVPSKNPKLVLDLVRFAQGRPEVASLFVASRYAALPGTLPLSEIFAEDALGRHPDVVVGYGFDETATVRCVSGVEFAGMTRSRYRGMHGTLGPDDLRAVLIAQGPHFHSGFRDPLPTGNADIAPTVAALLSLDLPGTDGRPLLEAIEGSGTIAGDYRLDAVTITPTTAGDHFTFTLYKKVLRRGGSAFAYLDQVQPRRQ